MARRTWKYSWRNKDLPLRWRFFRWLPTRSELAVARYDLGLWLRGTCAFKPWDPDERGGGYAHWRCQRPRGHAGLHRFRNYTSDAHRHVEYAPVDNWTGLDTAADKIVGQSFAQRLASVRADHRRWLAREAARQVA
jgi:hypothetical protein